MTVYISGPIATIPIVPIGPNPPSEPNLVYTISGSDTFLQYYGLGAACCSSNGQYIYICSYVINNTFFIISNNNFGNSANWSKKSISSLDGCAPQEMCCSSDGKYIYCVTSLNGFVGSSDYGGTWTSISVPATPIQGVTCNAAGTVVFLSIYNVSNKGVYTSTNISTSMANPTWTLSYNSSLGQVLGHVLNANSTKLYEYRYNFQPGTWNVAYIPVTEPNTLGSVVYSQISSVSNPSNAYNSTVLAGAVSDDGSKFAIGTYVSGYSGFVYTLNGGTSYSILADTGVQSVAMSGNGNYWITVGPSGIKYNQTGFSPATLIQGSNTVTTFKYIIAARSANYYFAFTNTQIYMGTYY